jgi:hypothetical protein
MLMALVFDPIRVTDGLAESRAKMVLKDGREAELVATYHCRMEPTTIYADGWNVPGKPEIRTSGSEMVLYVDGKMFDRSTPSYWGLIEVTDRPDAKKIWGLGIGFTNPEDAARYEAWIAELMDAGTSDEVKQIRAEEQRKREAEEAARAEKQRAFEAEKAEAESYFTSVDVKERHIRDEGGKTIKYVCTFTTKDGRVFRLLDRNLFDVGRIINPDYSVAEGLDEGGLVSKENGTLVWKKFVDADNEPHGWRTVRPLDKDELAAFKVMDYIGHAKSGIRM